MVLPTDGPTERMTELVKMAEPSTEESWYWGRISSTSATKLAA
jgi:hypothetical protein